MNKCLWCEEQIEKDEHIKKAIGVGVDGKGNDRPRWVTIKLTSNIIASQFCSRKCFDDYNIFWDAIYMWKRN